MSKPKIIDTMQTKAMILALRTWADDSYKRHRKRSLFLISVADRLEELDERVAIMTEHEATEDDLIFPPVDNELKDETNG